MTDPKLIEGGLAVDDRGRVGFVNGFSFAGVRRFYSLANHGRGFVRAWHGHKKESKYFTVVSGAAVIAGVRIDDWASPSASLEVRRFVLSGDKPAVLYMPAGFANGSMSLTENTLILVFSTSTLEESLDDDYRFDARFWDCWSVAER